MIRHIVFFSVAAAADRPKVRALLGELGTIPSVSRFEVSENLRSDPISGDVDLVVYAEFADDAALAAYRAHPVYAETTAKVRPLRSLRLSADVTAAD